MVTRYHASVLFLSGLLEHTGTTFFKQIMPYCENISYNRLQNLDHILILKNFVLFIYLAQYLSGSDSLCLYNLYHYFVHLSFFAGIFLKCETQNLSLAFHR